MTSANSLTVDDLGSAAQRERRRRILGATIEIASKGGFDAVQMRAVTQRADVALGTLYRYFPSKIHLLVSALGAQFEQTSRSLLKTQVPGDTSADRVIWVLTKATRAMQRDPNLTEALTRAFMFADKSVADEIHAVGMQLTRMLTHAMVGGEYDENRVITDEEAAIARVIADVWLSALVAWVTGRLSPDEVQAHMDTAIHLVLRD